MQGRPRLPVSRRHRSREGSPSLELHRRLLFSSSPPLQTPPRRPCDSSTPPSLRSPLLPVQVPLPLLPSLRWPPATTLRATSARISPPSSRRRPSSRRSSSSPVSSMMGGRRRRRPSSRRSSSSPVSSMMGGRRRRSRESCVPAPPHPHQNPPRPSSDGAETWQRSATPASVSAALRARAAIAAARPNPPPPLPPAAFDPVQQAACPPTGGCVYGSCYNGTACVCWLGASGPDCSTLAPRDPACDRCGCGRGGEARPRLR